MDGEIARVHPFPHVPKISIAALRLGRRRHLTVVVGKVGQIVQVLELRLQGRLNLSRC